MPANPPADKLILSCQRGGFRGTLPLQSQWQLGWNSPGPLSALEKAQSEGQRGAVLAGHKGHACSGLCQVPLKALPLGSCSEPAPGGGCSSLWTPGEALGTFLVISDFNNRDFVAKKWHPWSPACTPDQQKCGPWGFVAFANLSSPIHAVSLQLSRSSSASCSKQVFLHISSLWTSRNPEIICHFINKLYRLSPRTCHHADRCKHAQCVLFWDQNKGHLKAITLPGIRQTQLFKLLVQNSW